MKYLDKFKFPYVFGLLGIITLLALCDQEAWDVVFLSGLP